MILISGRDLYGRAGSCYSEGVAAPTEFGLAARAPIRVSFCTCIPSTPSPYPELRSAIRFFNRGFGPLGFSIATVGGVAVSTVSKDGRRLFRRSSGEFVGRNDGGKYQRRRAKRHYNNAFYARVGGISNAELNKLELELLFLLDFRVTVGSRVFESYCLFLEREMMMSNGADQRLERSLAPNGARDETVTSLDDDCPDQTAEMT
ncbi:hypothetical protein U1Q18_001326 [Sarracenia purpurea var. burkii]